MTIENIVKKRLVVDYLEMVGESTKAAYKEFSRARVIDLLEQVQAIDEEVEDRESKVSDMLDMLYTFDGVAYRPEDLTTGKTYRLKLQREELYNRAKAIERGI